MEPVELDIEAVNRLLLAIGGDHADFHELAEDFCESTPELVMNMRKASETEDWTAMRIAAHTLKANAREFGASELEALCKSLEQQAINQSVENVDAQLTHIADTLVSSITALERLELPDA